MLGVLSQPPAPLQNRQELPQSVRLVRHKMLEQGNRRHVQKFYIDKEQEHQHASRTLSERKEEIMHLREKVHLAGEELAQKDPELARREALLDQQIEGLRRDLERQRESERIMKEIMLDVEENI